MISAFEALSPTAHALLAEERLQKVFNEIGSQLALTNDRQAARDFTLDVKLGWLTGHVGTIANTTNRHDAVLRVASVTVAWLESFHLGPEEIMRLIENERQRQRDLFKARRFTFRVDSPLVCTWRKLRVLVEELGEVAEAVDQLEAHPKRGELNAHLVDELVQVAAVAVAWLESFHQASERAGK